MVAEGVSRIGLGQVGRVVHEPRLLEGKLVLAPVDGPKFEQCGPPRAPELFDADLADLRELLRIRWID